MGGSFQRTAVARLVPVSVPSPPLVWVVFGEGRNQLHPRPRSLGGDAVPGPKCDPSSCKPTRGSDRVPMFGTLAVVYQDP